MTLPYIVIGFILGAFIGSFLNVCIFRIPLGQDIVIKRSHCLSCGNALNWYELIPVLSYIFIKGHCHHCHAKLSPQYPIVEMINGLVYVLVIVRYGLTVTTLLYCLCASTLIVIAVIDWRTYEIPPGCNIFIGILGLINLCLDLHNWLLYLIGTLSVSGLFLLIYLLSKGRAIGGGDIKFMAAAGLLLGWEGALLALTLGAASGSVIHLALMKFKGKDRVLAFGPYLAFGVLAAMLYGEEIIGWYLQLYI